MELKPAIKFFKVKINPYYKCKCLFLSLLVIFQFAFKNIR